MILKVIKNVDNIKIFNAFIDSKYYLIVKSLRGYKYFYLNNNIDIVKVKNKLFIKTNDISLTAYLAQLTTRIAKWIKCYNKVYKKRLFLKGLGYKIDYRLIDKEKKIYDNTIFDIKIGNSHIISLKKKEIPSKIGFRFRKAKIINIESHDKVFLGNYVKKIVSYKLPDMYKGKGFWYRYQKINLKMVNKK